MKASVKKRVSLIMGINDQVEGELSLPQGMRISDFLNRKEKGDFIVVTNAKIHRRDGSQEKAEFLAVNKNHIVYLKEIKL